MNLQTNVQTNFDTVAILVKKIKIKPTDEELLTLYGLYKQGTLGNNTTDKPWIFEIEKTAKWNAWLKNINLTKEEAQKKYIDEAYKIINKYS